MAVTLDQLLASPDQYFYAFEGDHAVFVPMDRAAYRASYFLDQRIAPAAHGSTMVPVAALLAHPLPALPVHWIFHIAHCGSTLLARALEALDEGPGDGPGEGLVLREPAALRQLALAPDPARLRLALELLARRYSGARTTLIKANVPVNVVLDDIAAADPQARALMLYCALPDYLLAILRTPQHRAWLRGVTTQLAGQLGDLTALNVGELSDGELGAALWRAQMQRFAAALELLPHARSLDAERFFAAPAPVLYAAAQLFEVPASAAATRAVADGPLFQTYSKNAGAAFDNAARLARRRALASDLAPEIAAAERWLARAAPDIATVMAKLARAAL